MSASASAIKQAAMYPVPEPGTGEIVSVPIELLTAWLELNGRKIKGWNASRSVLITVLDKQTKQENLCSESKLP